MNRKPRILLIPNLAWWIIGEMGKQIIARFGHQYDLYFFPEEILARRPDMLRAMLPSLDAIHCLNESALDVLKGFDAAALPPIATWIHHVTSWSANHQAAVDRSAALITCTRGWKDYLDIHTSGRVPVTVVPHGVDAQAFQRRKIKPQRFGIPQGKFVIGFIGSKASDHDGGRKGTDVFFDVAIQAGKRIPHLHVLFGGPGWEKELALLHAEGVSASATGYIRKADLPALYSALDVYLMTSRVEGGPCTVFEAMACETVVVATKVGAVPELIVDGVNGFSPEVDDRESLLAAVLRTEQSAQMKKEIGRRARADVLQRSWPVALNPLEAVYDALVAQRTDTSPTTPAPAWMNSPQVLLRASCAADALTTVLPDIRSGSTTLRKGAAQLHEMLHGQSLLDIARGANMIWGRRSYTR